MKINELKSFLEVGKLPVTVHCEKKYEGICCMIKLTKNNTVFLDYDDAGLEGAFRATFRFDSFNKMLNSIEKYTKLTLDEMLLNPYCYEKFECSAPDWLSFQWDLYNGNIGILTDYSEFFIGSMWWRGLYYKQIRPDCSREELTDFVKKSSQFANKGE